MIKKILLSFITLFAFANMNAQNIVSIDSGCAGVNYEYENDGLDTGGKNSYKRTNTITALGTANSAVPGDNSVGVRYTGTEWEMYYSGGLLFTNSFAGAGMEAPDFGWVPAGAPGPCETGDTVNFVANDAVLGVERNELNDVSVYPNPSSDFINVSNLREAVQCKITNITGQTVMSDILDANNNQMNIENLSRGFYFVEIAGKKTIKLIKK